MSLGGASVSSVARRRIRSFSAAAWIAGALVMAGVGYTTYTGVGFGEDGFAMIDDYGDRDYPWEQGNPTEFDSDGDVWSGTGSGVIRIPRDVHNEEPYTARLETGEYLDLYQTDMTEVDVPLEDRWPLRAGDLYDAEDEALIIPGGDDLELWVRTEGDWSFTLRKTPVTEIENGVESGKGNGFFVYRGDAVSARFIHRGEGIFFVTVHPENGTPDQPIIETDSVDQRVSWDPTDAVYFTIESDEEYGAWTIDIDELATDAPTPDPDETDAPPADGSQPASPEPTPAALPAAATSRSQLGRTRGMPRA